MVSDSGTVLSGLSLCACGKPRLHGNNTGFDGTSLCVNLWVGLSQMITVTFMLVGWFWSVVWGIYMIILAGEFVVQYFPVCTP